jgi:hypothetical protein
MGCDIFIKKKDKVNEYYKYCIPDKPDLINREDVKDLFVKGITNSLYFMN